MPALICPLCRSPLASGETSWCCANRHNFDIAREGYLNLLPVQQKNSKAPGDNAAMLLARHDFLASGHYAPLRAAVVDWLRELAPHSVLDIGCGEGWYTSAFTDVIAAPAEGAGCDVTGIDIARDAVRRAARQHPDITWLVASGAALPLADSSVDLVTSLFSPLPETEMARVLKPGGGLLVVTPDARHLQSVREALFDDVQPHRPEKFVDELATHFELAEQRRLSFPLSLDNASLQQLLLMTPYAWRAKREKREALAASAHIAATAEFSLLLLRAKPIRH